MADTDNSDFEEHRKTYDGFMQVTKWSIISLVVVVLLLYIVIQP